MGGGLMQLVAYGAQDVYLTSSPQITFFKTVYRRHTQFAVESIQQVFSGAPDFGRRVTVTLQRNGDLVTKMYLQVVLPGVDSGDATKQWAWVSKFGHSLISYVELNIGGTRIDRQYGDWFNIWYELARNDSQDRGYNQLIGNTPELTTLAQAHSKAILYIPLYFFNCRSDGLALPLIALQYHDVRIEFEFFKADDLIISSGFTSNTPAFDMGIQMSDASLYVDYVYLDSEERKKFAQAAHEYLIECVQFTGAESVAITSYKSRLNFNHPCKALYWGLKLGRYVNPSGAYTYLAYHPSDLDQLRLEATKRFVLAMANYVNGQLDLSNNRLKINASYSGPLAAVFAAAQGAAITTDPLEDNITILGSLLTVDQVSTPVNTFLASLGGLRPVVGDGAAVFDVRVKQYDNYGTYINRVVNPFSSVLLQLNGHDRFSERDGNYFNYVQPYQHHTNTPADGINMYSFALNPEEHQPSGTCNMSRIDNATLNLSLGVDGVSDFKGTFLNDDSKLCIYAINYNILRIMSGINTDPLSQTVSCRKASKFSFMGKQCKNSARLISCM
jgi:hypothetical protein